MAQLDVKAQMVFSRICSTGAGQAAAVLAWLPTMRVALQAWCPQQAGSGEHERSHASHQRLESGIGAGGSAVHHACGSGGVRAKQPNALHCWSRAVLHRTATAA